MVKTKTNKSQAITQPAAEALISDAEQDVSGLVGDRGDTARQGDVMLTRVEWSDVLATGTPTEVKNPPLQLAPGTTQGSRHCLRSLDGVRVYRLARPGPLDGPVLVAERAFAVDHPEHGDLVLGPGTYAVTYQRAFAEELRRVAD